MLYNPDAPITEMHIPTRGCYSPYAEFHNMFTGDVLGRAHSAAVEVVRLAAPAIDLNTVFASGFGDEFDPTDIAGSMARVDAFKMNVPSTVGDRGLRAPIIDRSVEGDLDFGDFSYYDAYFGGDDSNTVNIHRRMIQDLRLEKAALAVPFEEGDGYGGLTVPDDYRGAEAYARELQRLNNEIARLQAMEVPMQPVYYATLLGGLLVPTNENNPLAYVGEGPTISYLGFYDGTSLRQDPDLEVTNKTPEQLRITGSGATLMRHALGVMRLIFD